VDQAGRAEVANRAVVTGAQRVVVSDLAALYAQHRDAMYRVAYATLRSSGMTSSAEDAVSAAVVSIMKNGLPSDVENWEAFLVNAAKRKAQDIAKSAVVQRAGPPFDMEHDRPADDDVAEEVADGVDLERRVQLLQTSLGVLDDRQRLVAIEYVGAERPRAEIAAELGVTPARVSQIKLEVLTLLDDEMTGREDQR
jgi:RNA polymerase sigma factor (sigma-70 family)